MTTRVNDYGPLLAQGARALSDGNAKLALDALTHWGNQKFDRRTSTLSDAEARDAAMQFVGALTEVLYVLEDRRRTVQCQDGADAIRCLADTYGDEPRLLPGQPWRKD